MALEHLVRSNLAVPCTHYFDDFTFIVPKAIAEQTDEMTKEFFDILGWDVKLEKDKPIRSSWSETSLRG